MDISKCPIFKSHVAEAEFEKKFGHVCARYSFAGWRGIASSWCYQIRTE
jgi:hypothetical protein